MCVHAFYMYCPTLQSQVEAPRWLVVLASSDPFPVSGLHRVKARVEISLVSRPSDWGDNQGFGLHNVNLWTANKFYTCIGRSREQFIV